MGDRVEDLLQVEGAAGRCYDLLGLVVAVEGRGSMPIDSVQLRVRSREGSPVVVVASMKVAGHFLSISDCRLNALDAWLDKSWAETIDLAPQSPHAFENRKRLTLECFNRYAASGYCAFQVTRLPSGLDEIKFFELGEIDE